jgi:hypothetical protein
MGAFVKLTTACTLALLILAMACGGSSSATPTAPTPVTTYSLSGRVSGRVTGTAAVGTVTAADGSPLSIRASGPLDKDGNYRLVGLLPGSYTITVEASGYLGKSRTVTITSDATLDVSLEWEGQFEFLDHGNVLGQVNTSYALVAVPLVASAFPTNISSCRWTSTSTEPWVTLTPTEGTGGEAVTMSVTRSDVPQRCALVWIGHKRVTIYSTGAIPAGYVYDPHYCDAYWAQYPVNRE